MFHSRLALFCSIVSVSARTPPNLRVLWSKPPIASHAARPLLLLQPSLLPPHLRVEMLGENHAHLQFCQNLRVIGDIAQPYSTKPSCLRPLEEEGISALLPDLPIYLLYFWNFLRILDKLGIYRSS